MSSLVGVDVGRVLDLGISLHELWSMPVQIALALVLLYLQVRRGRPWRRGEGGSTCGHPGAGAFR